MKINSKSLPKIIYAVAFIIILISSNKSLASQDLNSISKSYKDDVISSVAKELKDRYVFPERAEQISVSIIDKNQQGHYNQYDQLDSFLESLNDDICNICKDKHISVSLKKGKGIVPDINVSSESALKEALPLAIKAAEKFKAENDKMAKEVLISLNDIVSNYDGENDETIVDAYLKCRDHYIIFEEWELNSLGYQFIRNDKKATALTIFKTNTILYPHSANVIDSYAEALASSGNQAEAIKKYEKAIDIAKSSKDDRLEIFTTNLNKIKN